MPVSRRLIAAIVATVAFLALVPPTAHAEPAGVFTTFEEVRGSSAPSSIALGPDGAMWFTQNVGNRIGRITMDGTITEFAVPTPDAGPWGIALGGDGSMWIAERTASRISRLGTGSGALVSAVIKGAARVGSSLTCAASPSPALGKVALSYSWQRNGDDIARATSRQYRPATQDVGARLSCRAVVTTIPALTVLSARSSLTPRLR
jgi:hypothetical protein